MAGGVEEMSGHFINKILQGDALEMLKTLPDECVNCCVTSPPYYGLRDYGVPGQIGLEDTPEQYIEKMVAVFAEVRRAMRDDGTLWLNIGDTYAAYWGQKYGQGQSLSGSRENNGSAPPAKKSPVFGGVIKPKDLFGIPWMLAFALRGNGWYLRADIIWHKHPCMPESVVDRPTKSHEYIFLLAKSEKYYYDIDSIREPLAFNRFSMSNKNGSAGNKFKYNNGASGQNPHSFQRNGHSGYFDGNGKPLFNELGRNKRSVWQIQPAQFSEAHFATFPEEIPELCIKAGCPAGGIVLDPFMGAGTTALVARKLDRNFIGVELNPQYIKIAETRLRNELGMFQ